MSRFSRINTIWRKELVDTLRDRRTLVAMVLVPLVLYPALMLGSLQALQVQVGFLLADQYTVGVETQTAQAWLRRMIDSDPARRIEGAEQATAEEIAAEAAKRERTPRDDEAISPTLLADEEDEDKFGAIETPPPYNVVVVQDIEQAVLDGRVHAGVVLDGPPPLPDTVRSTSLRLIFDESDIRSEIAAAGIEGVLRRANERMLQHRLAERQIDISFIQPLAMTRSNIATEERMTGSVLGQIVPLILIIMTITGAIYPAIDLTAGERERGTLETLMVAPVPTVDLIAGKFVVVTLIGMISALLNLLSIGGTIYLGGVGEVLTKGKELVLPVGVLPLIFLLLVPLAVLFSALLLAVCSFARSFKEAQNYIVPVMMAALIPGVLGVLPGTRLEGPLLIMPVANVVVLTRELFMERIDVAAILIVVLSTSLYAAAAVAVAARLFGQEAVLFSDSGSIRTIFQRRFFQPKPAPSAATGLLVVAMVFSLNFFIQQAILRTLPPGLAFLCAIALTLVMLLVLGPLLATLYVRADVARTFRLTPPPLAGVLAGLCFGLSTWILAPAWLQFQQSWFPIDPQTQAILEAQSSWLHALNPWVLVFLLAIVPGVCEEFFFRGFALSAVRSSLGKFGAVLIVALAFGLSHHMAHRLFITTLLGLLLGMLVVQFGSIWPAVLAHLLHNGIAILADHPGGLRPLFERMGFVEQASGYPPQAWLLGAAALTGVGILLCMLAGEWSSGAAARADLSPAHTKTEPG